MSSKLDQSLEDVIKSNPGRRSGRGGARGSGPRRSSSGGAPPTTASNPLSRTEESNGDANGSGPIRRQRQGGRSNGPYQRPDSYRQPRGQFDDNTEWKHDLHQQEQQAQARLNADKIYVANLDTDVNEDDVKEIFGKVGKIVKVVINFNQHGKSLGTAEVTFGRKGDAEKAVAEYDGAEVDGRPMTVKLVGTLVQPRVVTKRNPPPQPQQYQQRQPRRDQGFQQRPRQSNRGGQGSRQGGNRQGGRGGRQAGAGRREKTPAPTLESLDAELDSYHTKPTPAAAGQPSAPSAAAAGQPASA